MNFIKNIHADINSNTNPLYKIKTFSKNSQNHKINTKDSQISVHQIGTMQQKSVNFLWTAQTKLTCKNYFSNNLQEVKWVI
jgi:hypothetical protein